MTATLFSLLALFASGFSIMLGNGLINILLPARLAAEQISADSIGMIMSMFAVGLMLGGIYTRKLVVRVGHIRVYAASAAMAAISILVCYLWLNEWLWAVMRILLGFCIASTNIVADGWLSERASPDTRSRILATNQIVILGAMFLGSFMINLAEVGAPTLYIIAGLLLCSGVVPIALSRASAPEIDDSPPMPLLKLAQTSPVGITAVLMCGLVLGSLLSMLAVYGQAKGIQGVELSLLVGSAIIGGVVLQFPIGYLADRFERRKVMLAIALLSIVCTLVTPVLVDAAHFTAVLVFVALSSGIVSSFYPLGIAETFDRLQQSEMGKAMGAMIIVYASGGVIGPYLVGLVMEHFSANHFFSTMAATQLLFVLFVLYRTSVRKSIPTAEQEAFVAQGATGWVSAELDPRLEHSESSELSPAAQTALDMAQQNPALALKMVALIAKSDPEQLVEVAGAVASVEGVDTSALYRQLDHSALEETQQHELLQSLVSATPESSAELANTVFEVADNTEIAELASAMTEAAPEQSLEIIEAATEAVVEDNPEIVVDIAQVYLNNLTTQREEMRYADRLADDSEQALSDVVSMMTEKAPEQAEELAAVLPEEQSGEPETPRD